MSAPVTVATSSIERSYSCRKIWIILTLAECDTLLEDSIAISVINTAVGAPMPISKNLALDGKYSGIAVGPMLVERQASTGIEGDSLTCWVMGRVFENVLYPRVVLSELLGKLDGHKLNLTASGIGSL